MKNFSGRLLSSEARTNKGTADAHAREGGTVRTSWGKNSRKTEKAQLYLRQKKDEPERRWVWGARPESSSRKERILASGGGGGPGGREPWRDGKKKIQMTSCPKKTVLCSSNWEGGDNKHREKERGVEFMQKPGGGHLG